MSQKVKIAKLEKENAELRAKLEGGSKSKPKPKPSATDAPA